MQSLSDIFSQNKNLYRKEMKKQRDGYPETLQTISIGW